MCSDEEILLQVRGLVWWVVAGVGTAAVVRQRLEAVRTRAGELPPLGPDGLATGEPVADARTGRVHGALAGWRPERPRSAAGRVTALVWAAPLTAIGLLAGALGGGRPRWDPAHGALVLPGVRGPARWFLRMQSASAATLGHVVVLREQTVDDRLLVHEALHARQQERLGPLFAVAYPVASALWGYRRNPFEVAARDAARVSGPPGPA